MGYVHRDLKPLNICLKNGIPYIIDFGFTKQIIINKKQIKKKLIGCGKTLLRKSLRSRVILVNIKVLYQKALQKSCKYIAYTVAQ